MNGSNSITNVGTYDSDKSIGSVKGRFKFLKNSISSNKFNITPKQIKIKIAFKITFKNLNTKNLFIILFILYFFGHHFFE